MSEKFPWLFERRYGIKAFDYWWGYTTAQIELMVADQPVISYKREDKKSERSMFGTKAEADEMEALADAWKAQNGDGVAGKTISLSEFVGGNSLP